MMKSASAARRAILDEAQDEIEVANANRRKPGRPRSSSSRSAILDSVNRLLLRDSVRTLTIESVAQKAGVGKTTIYRWWPNKTALVLEAYFEQIGPVPSISSAGTVREALSIHLDKVLKLLKGRSGRIIAETLAEAQADEAALALVQKEFFKPLWQEFSAILAFGQEHEVFRTDLTAARAFDFTYAPVFFRLFTSGEELDQSFAEDWKDQIFRMLAA